MFQVRRPQKISAEEVFPEYLEICRRVSAQLTRAGLDVPAAGSQAEVRFFSHPRPRRVIDVLRAYSEVLQSQLDAGESLRDDKKLLWRMLAKLGYVPRSGVFDSIEAGDVIEVFTGDNWQIFRNMAYFDLVHITVDEPAT
ncbi:MAG TPA: hypothetical protein PL182_04890, partial [Pseudobdellovibrionaceae bacterium]|nr:hypothetical protein [Pseudobdellovibrionaceae bacterium]